MVLCTLSSEPNLPSDCLALLLNKLSPNCSKEQNLVPVLKELPASWEDRPVETIMESRATVGCTEHHTMGACGGCPNPTLRGRVVVRENFTRT